MKIILFFFSSVLLLFTLTACNPSDKVTAEVTTKPIATAKLEIFK